MHNLISHIRKIKEKEAYNEVKEFQKFLINGNSKINLKTFIVYFHQFQGVLFARYFGGDFLK